MSCAVSVNDKVYYDSITRIRSKNQIVTKIGNSFSITYRNSHDIINFNFKATKMLRDRVKDTEFFIDALKSKHFTINDVEFDLNPTQIVFESFKLEQQEKNLNVKKDINIEKLTEQECQEIYNLITAFSDRMVVSNLRKDLPPVCRIKIQDIKLLLVFEKNSDEEIAYNIYDFFKSNLIVCYNIDNSEEKYITSQYSILQKDDYLNIDNIDYNSILPSYQSLLKNHSQIISRANNDMLIMLTAYDEGECKNKKLLELAKDLAKWIMNEDKEELSFEIKLINYLQIIRRERQFNIDEVKQLCSITEDRLMGEDVKTGAYLLLGNQLAAEVHFFKMEPDLQEAFKKYPIYKFWNKVKEDKINGYT